MRGLLIFITAFLLTSAVIRSCAPKDATDPPGGVSGMDLHTDHETGCQYLSKPSGGITPRLDAQGRHMGCKR